MHNYVFITFIIKPVTSNKSSLLLLIDLQNMQTLLITTKLKWKLFTKVIRGLGLDRQCLIKKEGQAL